MRRAKHNSSDDDADDDYQPEKSSSFAGNGHQNSKVGNNVSNQGGKAKKKDSTTKEGKKSTKQAKASSSSSTKNGGSEKTIALQNGATKSKRGREDNKGGRKGNPKKAKTDSNSLANVGKGEKKNNGKEKKESLLNKGGKDATNHKNDKVGSKKEKEKQRFEHREASPKKKKIINIAELDTSEWLPLEEANKRWILRMLEGELLQVLAKCPNARKDEVKQKLSELVNKKIRAKLDALLVPPQPSSTLTLDKVAQEKDKLARAVNANTHTIALLTTEIETKKSELEEQRAAYQQLMAKREQADKKMMKLAQGELHAVLRGDRVIMEESNEEGKGKEREKEKEKGKGKGKGKEVDNNKKTSRASFPPKRGIFNPYEKVEGAQLGEMMVREGEVALQFPGKGGREIKDAKKELNAKLLEVAAEGQAVLEFVEGATAARDALVSLLSAYDPNITPLSFTVK